MGELLPDHTTLRLGGPADLFLTQTDPAAWPDLAQTRLPIACIDFELAAPGGHLEDVAYMLCKRNMRPSVLCLSDWLASQLPCAKSFGRPNPSAGSYGTEHSPAP